MPARVNLCPRGMTARVKLPLINGRHLPHPICYNHSGSFGWYGNPQQGSLASCQYRLQRLSEGDAVKRMRQSALHGNVQKSAEMTDSAKRVAAMVQKMHWEENHSLHDVAKALGLSWPGLQWYLNNYDIPRKERVQSMREKFVDGWTHVKEGPHIHKRSGVRRHSKVRKIEKRNVDPTRKPSFHVVLKVPGHPNANSRGYIPEHRYLMAEHLGRPLRKDELIHHKNGDPLDNRLDNLEVRLRGVPEDYHHGPLSVCPQCGYDLFSR